MFRLLFLIGIIVINSIAVDSQDYKVLEGYNLHIKDIRKVVKSCYKSNRKEMRYLFVSNVIETEVQYKLDKKEYSQEDRKTFITGKNGTTEILNILVDYCSSNKKAISYVNGAKVKYAKMDSDIKKLEFLSSWIKVITDEFADISIEMDGKF